VGALTIRLVARAAERRLESKRLALSALSSKSSEAVIDGSAVRAGGNTTAIEECESRRTNVAGAVPVSGNGRSGKTQTDVTPARTTYPTVPVTVWDLPAFARRRRSGESFTDFAERMGLS
jgi:hypothetical protein